MTFLVSQENVDLKIKSDLGDDALIVDEITVDESLHDLFDIRIIAHSSDINIAFSDVLGTNMTVTLNLHSGKRHFSGIVARFEQLHTTVIDKNKELTAFYQIRLVPKFWLLTHTKDYRIFQNKTVQEIIKEILSESQVTDYTYKTQKGTSSKREYCVQYGESNYEFITRLCEEEGIFFHFDHESALHKLYFSDGSLVASKIGGKGYPYAVRTPSQPLVNHIYECFLSEQITATDLKIVDYNYLKPSVELLGESSGDGLGGSYYDYPGLFQESSEGTSLAKMRLDALNWSAKAIHGSSTIADLMPYKKFSVINHPRDSINGEYIVYKVRHKVSQTKLNSTEGYERAYDNQFWAFPSSITFVPQPKHEKKRIHSLQTASVTGPDGEEIYTDEHGRIKVKFHWDQRGEANEKSSCWIRVTQTWAGSQWGAFVLPRIGMEVVVSFLDGDPDRPLVMGCVYNGENLPPYNSNDPTKSTFKTSSSKGNDGNNELRFDDKKGSEEVYLHAEKDMNVVIEDSRTEEIVTGDDSLTIKKGSKSEKLDGKGTTYSTEIKDGDKTLTIKKGGHTVELSKGDEDITLKKGDQSITLKKGDQTITLKKGDQTIDIGVGNQTTKIKKGDMEITINKGDLKIKATGDVSITATGDMSFKSTGKISMKGIGGIMIESPQAIQVKSGMNIVNQAGMNYNVQAGMNMLLNAGTNAVLKGGVNVAVDAGVALAAKGTAINLTASGIGAFNASGPLALKGAILKLN